MVPLLILLRSSKLTSGLIKTLILLDYLWALLFKNIEKLAVKKIYIVRHGQTKFNEQGIVQGRGVDASLNETGKRQAAQFYDRYKKLGFQRILISSLKRTYESVEKFIRDGVPFDIHEGLDEISWGIHEGAQASELRNEYFRNMVSKWRAGETDYKIEGGESPQEVAERQLPVIELIKQLEEERILVCKGGSDPFFSLVLIALFVLTPKWI